MAQAECGIKDPHSGRWSRDLLVFHGPSIEVDIGFDSTYDPNTPARLPQSGAKNVWALVDTGAQETFIDNALATSLNLPIVDRIRVSGSVGRHLTNVYSAQMHIPSLIFTIWGRFAGVNLVSGGQAHMALIGRSFLCYSYAISK